MESSSKTDEDDLVVLVDPQEIIRQLELRKSELEQELVEANGTIHKLNEEAGNSQAIIKMLQEDSGLSQANLVEVGNAEELQQEMMTLMEKLQEDKTALENKLEVSLEANEDLEWNIKREREEMEKWIKQLAEALGVEVASEMEARSVEYKRRILEEVKKLKQGWTSKVATLTGCVPPLVKILKEGEEQASTSEIVGNSSQDPDLPNLKSPASAPQSPEDTSSGSCSDSDEEEPPAIKRVPAILSLLGTPTGKASSPRKRPFPDTSTPTSTGNAEKKKQRSELLRIQCGLCYEEPSYVYSCFQLHLRNEHNITEPFQPYRYEFKCDACEKTPRSLTALLEHQYYKTDKCADDEAIFVFTELTYSQKIIKREEDRERRKVRQRLDYALPESTSGPEPKPTTSRLGAEVIDIE